MSQQQSWVPRDSCTLPTAEQPLRVAEFSMLFGGLRAVERASPTTLRLILWDSPGVEDAARALTARETSCCRFFDFAVASGTRGVTIIVRVPASRADVLDGLQRQAERTPRHQRPMNLPSRRTQEKTGRAHHAHHHRPALRGDRLSP